MAENCKTNLDIKFEDYDQSSRCINLRDSSVSYAAAVVTAAAQ
jgi:predicted class III extradiol MEMO1 family dioxygenase